MEMFRIKSFFHEMLELSYTDLRSGWGNPCCHLLESMCMYQESFLKKIEGDYTNDSHEYRLNNAGLKMYWGVERTKCTGDIATVKKVFKTSEAHFDRFKCSIGGDQAKEYPMFVAKATLLINKYKFNKH
jgi:hypothetical protein